MWAKDVENYNLLVFSYQWSIVYENSSIPLTQLFKSDGSYLYCAHSIQSVSYTHLDVYKRQPYHGVVDVNKK